MKTPDEIADEIIETANDATRIVDGAHSCPAGHDDEDADYFCCGCLRSMIAAAISAERSAGLSDGGKDRKATPKLSAKPAPACARCGGSEKIVIREWQERNESGTFEWRVERTACPECRGKP